MNPRGGSRKDRGSVSPYSAPPSLGFLFALRPYGSPAPPTLLSIQRGSQGPSGESAAPWAQGAKSAAEAGPGTMPLYAVRSSSWPGRPHRFPASLQSFFSS